MKNVIFLIAIVLLITTASAQKLIGVPDNTKTKLKGNSKKLARKGYKYYGIESGSVMYTGEDSTFFSQLYFDRYGLREVKFERGISDFKGMKTDYNLLYLRDGELNIIIDLEDTTGRLFPYWDAEITTPEQRIALEMEGSRTTKLDTQIHLERECEVWEFYRIRKSYQTWLWEGIILKNNVLRKYQADSIEIGVELDTDPFEILKKVKVIWNSVGDTY
ncbi:MAG: hypothetical protein GY816_18420 [Cytophagales bacterium]|nr:hypothetical protein [Cytophagales bacterium]